MTRTKSDDKRATILDAAIGLFSRYGFKRTSIDDVAREAGIAKGTVYLYFENKEVLFTEVCRHVARVFLDRTEAAFDSDAPVVERVLAILRAKFTYLYEIVHASPHAAEIIQSKNQVAAEIFVAADERYLDLLARALATANRKGALALAAVGMSPRAAAALLIRCAHGNGAGDPPGVRPDLAEYERRLSEVTRVVLAGLGAEV
jgi:AcrR family transcriptional regulator